MTLEKNEVPYATNGMPVYGVQPLLGFLHAKAFSYKLRALVFNVGPSTHCDCC